MIVDEDKKYCVFKLEESRKTYSDHKSKPCNSNRETKEEQDNHQMWIQKHRDKLTQKQIRTPLKIQISYDKWSEEVQNNIKGVEKIFRQNPRKNIN